VIINKQVYNLTTFLKDHPGGANVISKYAGRDATPAFSRIHSTDILQTLPPEHYKGPIDPSTIVPDEQADDDSSLQQKPPKPPLEALLNVFDFEEIAKAQMEPSGWMYYSSGADDEITLRENHAAFHRIYFRPRVLVNVDRIDTSTTFLGSPTSFPLYISATALGKLAHPEGEVLLTRAAYNTGIIQMIPTLASCSLNEMTSARQENQVQWFQLYVNKNRKITEDIVKHAIAQGCKAICLTVDAPGLARREKDMSLKFRAELPDVITKDDSTSKAATKKRTQGVTQTLTTWLDGSVCWKDIDWLKSITGDVPIVLKGIQCAEDAVLAVQHGIKGIILSNHGGRQLDFARSGVEVLPEVMSALRAIHAEKDIEVYVDGGIRRGTDIFKCLALGARGVGIGRPTLYGMASYGEAGATRVIEMLHEELILVMKLLGTPTLNDIRPEMVITRNLSDHTVFITDSLSSSIYQPLVPQSAFSRL